jgi:hypothetical protein
LNEPVPPDDGTDTILPCIAGNSNFNKPKKKKAVAYATTFFDKALLYNIGNQCKLTCTLNCYSQCSLMLSTVTCDPAGKDLSALGNVLTYKICILVINNLILICTEYTYFLTSAHGSSSHGSRLSLLILIVRHFYPPSYLKGRSFSIPSGMLIKSSAEAFLGEGSATEAG